MRSAIVDRPIEINALVHEVARTANGATLVFIGTVRDVNNGRAITGMEYTAYNAMAERELADITREASEQFATEDIVVEHRIGALGLGATWAPVNASVSTVGSNSVVTQSASTNQTYFRLHHQ